MDSIKKYRNVHPDSNEISFSIKRMEEIYEIHHGKADEPHRHDYFTIILVKQGKGKHIIDFTEFTLSDKQVYFISPGQVHQIIEKGKPFGYALTFSRQFMLENGIEKRFIDDLHLFQDFGHTPPLNINDSQLQVLVSIIEEIFTFLHSNKKFKYQALGALLKLFLIQANNFCSLSGEENTQTVQASVSLLRNFKELLDKHFRAWHKVSEFATALHISSDYLNSSVKSLTGKSAKEHIQSRITVEAKRLLLFSDYTTKEIAYELGFSEPANFSQFFKKCTGQSPSAFRK